MQINNDVANSIYSNYTSRTFVRALGRENEYAKGYINGIFESAAGPDGVLSEEEASAVDKFFQDIGKNPDLNLTLEQINPEEAKALCTQWSEKAANYLPSITSSDEISQGFSQLLGSMKEITGDASFIKNEVFALKERVFFARIIKGQNALGQNTKDLIRQNIEKVGEFAKKWQGTVNIGISIKTGQFCAALLSITAKDDDEVKALYNSFVNKYFPNNLFFKKAD